LLTFVSGALLIALTTMMVKDSPGLHQVDHTIVDAAHGHVLGRQELIDLLGVISVITHPNTMRALTVLVLIRLLFTGRHRWALWLGVTMALGGLASPVVKNLVARPRPVFGEPVATAAGYAFPSGHALNSMLFALCLLTLAGHGAPGRGATRGIVRAAAPALVVVTALDRIGLGVHYPSDVLAGWLIALLTLNLTTLALGSWCRDTRYSQGAPRSARPQATDRRTAVVAPAGGPIRPAGPGHGRRGVRTQRHDHRDT
jgi:undecaprenyl-diphosphatase